MAPTLSYINYQHKSEVPIIQHATQQYELETVWIAPMQSKVATMENTDNFCYKSNPSCANAKSTRFAASKRWMGHKRGHW